MQLHLKKFDISSIKCNTVIVFIGRRNTGKSFLVQDLLYYHKDIPIGTVISATESSSPCYCKIVPSLFIHDDYTPQITDNVLRRQKMIKKRINKEMACYGKCNIDPRAFLLLDDCLYDNCWKNDKNISYFFMNGRHVDIFLLITMQFPLGIPPKLRGNIDYVFILREPFLSNRKRIYDNYAGMFPTFELFCHVMDATTEDFECLVIATNSRSNKLEDQVFWYKAQDHGNFTIGSKEFWVAHNENVNEESEDELFDVTQFRKKKQGPIVNIKKSFK